MSSISCLSNVCNIFSLAPLDFLLQSSHCLISFSLCFLAKFYPPCRLLHCFVYEPVIVTAHLFYASIVSVDAYDENRIWYMALGLSSNYCQVISAR